MVKVVVRKADVRSIPCDLLVMKHADGFYGADERVAETVSFGLAVPIGQHRIVAGAYTGAQSVAFVGVGPLQDFRYEAIRRFGRELVDIAGGIDARVVATTTHGAGYGLDERESFLSLLGGIHDGLKSGPASLHEVIVVELDEGRAGRLRRYLSEMQVAARPDDLSTNSLETARVGRGLCGYGQFSERKPRLFVAMPFAGDFSDVREIAIQEAAERTGFLCETMINKVFVGDIFAEIKRQLHASDGIIAVLDRENPNVFLELGYAMGLDKPAILIIKKDASLPFDVSGQHCLIYQNINGLRTSLTNELKQLKEQGVFNHM